MINGRNTQKVAILTFNRDWRNFANPFQKEVSRKLSGRVRRELYMLDVNRVRGLIRDKLVEAHKES